MSSSLNLVVRRMSLMPANSVKGCVDLSSRPRSKAKEMAHQILRQGQRIASQPLQQFDLTRPALFVAGLLRDLADKIAERIRHQKRMAHAFERRQLLAAFGSRGRRQHGLFVPAQKRDGV